MQSTNISILVSISRSLFGQTRSLSRSGLYWDICVETYSTVSTW